MVQAVMPTPKAQPAPDFIPADAPDFIPADGGDTPKQGSAPPAQQPGFLENLGASFGISKDAENERKEHPIRSMIQNYPPVAAASGILSGAKRMGGELLESIKSLRDGNPAEAAVHGVTAIPLIGPALNKMADEAPPVQPGQSYGSKILDAATPGNVGTALGTAAQAAPIALGGLDVAAPERPLVGEIPTIKKAGQKFQTVMQDAANQPVSLTRSLPILERMQQLSERGHGTIGALDNLYRRVNTVNPLDYAEARDRASAISSLTGEDKIKSTKTLRGEAKRFSHAFNEDVGDAAAAAGRGEEYQQAMRDYARAMTLRKALVNTAKYGIPAAVGGGLLNKTLQSVVPSR